LIIEGRGDIMKIRKVDLLILIIPVLIMLLLYPVLPHKIPMQFKLNGSVSWYLDKRYSFLLGLLPFVIYEYYKSKRKR
jgi:uncharacterized membrane protein